MSKEVEIVQDDVVELQPWMEILPMVKSSDDQAADMVASILEAADLEGILALSETIGLRELVGKTLTLRGASLRIGEVDRKQTIYATINGFNDDTGEDLVITTGAAKVLAQLAKFQMLNLWPVRVRVISIASKTDPLRKTLQFVSPESF